MLSGVNDVHCWLGRSMYAGDAGLAGSIDEFRIYAGAFTPAQVMADFNAGPATVVLPPPVPGSNNPQLTAARSGSNLVLTWPTSATGFSLQTTSALGSSASWSAVTTAPTVVNGNNQVTLPLGTQAAFFRLKQ